MLETFPVFAKKKLRKLRLVHKQKSWLMQIISVILHLGTKLKLCNLTREEFLNNYITMIGNTIYGPKEWTVDWNSTFCHELIHYFQYNNNRLNFILEYLFSKKRRCYYESVACQVELAFGANRVYWLNRNREMLLNYGLGWKLIVNELCNRISEHNRGLYQIEVMAILRLYAEWEQCCTKKSAG